MQDDLGPGLGDNPVPGHRNHLFLNHGGCWRDHTEASGARDDTPDGPHRTIAGAFGDYDRDGCIDLYLVHWRMGGEVDAVFHWDTKGQILEGDVLSLVGKHLTFRKNMMHNVIKKPEHLK